ncbi:MAG: DNA-binding protein [Deltaproteobacteria bacterium HGW-Deltaproteobacteria-11]|nr:MAG: DNA-binding protein [Deltaproteobacteria bacterium HGW-Deltaproteobacteria-11]
MNGSSKNWADQADYDLDSARAMLDAGRYVYVLFCCQQAVEKMLKAIIAERSRELPPRIHNLTRLSRAAAIETTGDQIDFMRELSAYYVQTRYPEEMTHLASEVSEDMAKEIMNRTEDMALWLRSILR